MSMSEDRKYRILVVDDEASVLITYRLILERHGYDVVACPTSRDDTPALNGHELDGLLCDYSREEQPTGSEVISAARDRDAALPVALPTGYATKEPADEAPSRNIDIMFKPIEIEEFLGTTERLVQEKRPDDN